MGEMGTFALFASAAAVVAFVLISALTRRSPAADRLAEEGEGESALGELADSLGRDLPVGGRDLAQIQPELLRAGFYRPTSLARYRAARAVLILSPLVGAGLLCLLVPPTRVPLVAVSGLAFAALGYSLPRVYVANKARARTSETERGLPAFADLLALSLLAGQNVLNGLRRVASELKWSYPVLAEELGLVVRQAELTSLPHSLEQWADRSQVPDVRDLAAVVSQAQRMGTDVTGALMEFATNLRAGLIQRADARAQRVGLWMMFPNIICLWIPAAVILVAPIGFEFQERRAKSREALQTQMGGDLQGAIQKVNEKNRPRNPERAGAKE
jgi:tight adherence protein C